MQIECQNAFIAAVQVDKAARRVEGHAARIRDPRIPAKRSHEFTVRAEGENRAVAVAIGSAGAGDEDQHGDRLFVQPMPHAANLTLPRRCTSSDLLKSITAINVRIINRTKKHVIRFDFHN
jgi:hypothetical protein